MSTPSSTAAALQRAMLVLQAWHDGNAEEADALQVLQETRVSVPSANLPLDELLLHQLGHTRKGLLKARGGLDEAQCLLDQYSAAPLIPGIYIQGEVTRHGGMAVVSSGGGRRAVAFGKDIDGGTLRCGDRIYLSSDMSVLVATAESVRLEGGEMAAFVRYTADGRVIIRSNGEEQVVLEAASTLDEVVLRPGDTVRWDRSARLCLEKMTDADRCPYLLEQVEDISLDSIGGQKENLGRIMDALVIGLLYPDRARSYRLPFSNTVLLYGPPGNGKTYMTRAVFSEIQRRSGKKVFLSAVKASQWESMWVGQTQANISALFSSMRTAAQDGHIAVLFVDEIDSVGRIRGSHSSHHSDKALGTLLTEINGFQDMRNVSVVTACNRPDLLDSALRSRMGVEIPIRRPDMRGAREIFSIHLEADLPYNALNGRGKQTRFEMIDRAVSRLYAPNAESEICVLKLRDGKTRSVTSAELVSGRLIQQITQAAKNRGLRREIETGQPGMIVEDMEEAVAEAHERLTSTLTPHNVHNHLDTLSEDEVVMAVEPIRRRVARPRRFLNVA